MRPLELRLAGFRSYRSERTVALAELDLVAIIGDTGAGKSSLLEAITWALYGASTWSKKAHMDLLAHGAKRMSVALTFEASGERWELTRTFARSGQGGAQLTCLTDTTIPRVDGVTEVDRRVPDIVGLDYEVFCSCVLLPQGKFERLLKAKPAERTDRLKKILRLDQLADARDVATQHASLLRDRELELREARGRFRPDPADDLRRARHTIDELAPMRERLAGVVDTLARLDEEVTALRAGEVDAGTAAQRLEARRGRWPADLSALGHRAAVLGPQLATCANERRGAEDRLVALQRRLEEAVAAGVDAASLSRHSDRLEGLREELAHRTAAQSRLDACRVGLRDAETRAGLEAEAAQSAEAALLDHDRALAAAETAAKDAAEALRTLEESLERAARAAEDVAAAEAEHAGASTAVAEARAALEPARAALVAAEARYVASAHAHEAAVRANAAAHAAEGCEPGDPCPVCTRALPADFRAPSAEGLARADDDRADAERQRNEETRAVAAREGDLRVAEGRLEQAANRRDAARVAYEAARAAVAGLPDDEVGRRRSALDAARTLHDSLREARPAAQRAATDAAAQVAAADAQREAQRSALIEAEAALAERGERIARLLAALPRFAALPAADELTDASLVTAAEAVAARREDARALEGDVSRAREVLDAARSRESDTKLEYEREVSGPSGRALDGMRALTAELPLARRDGLPGTPASTDLDGLRALAEALDRAVATELSDLERAATEARTRMAEAGEQATRILADTGHPTREGLRGRLDEIRAEVLAAERDCAAAERELPGATRLDELIARAARLRTGLEALRDALNDGAFVGYVVARRQRALLAHASRVLQDITGRYAFTEDFRILDRESGLPRSPDTLSGGETFIASLALALGLVEVADRSGGDLRALFLDEGFGTLDATVLDTALTALQERAKGGRLIGLISHVPTVAERIDTVLEVRSTVEGSDVVLLTGEERDRRVMEHVGAAAGAA